MDSEKLFAAGLPIQPVVPTLSFFQSSSEMQIILHFLKLEKLFQLLT